MWLCLKFYTPASRMYIFHDCSLSCAACAACILCQITGKSHILSWSLGMHDRCCSNWTHTCVYEQKLPVFLLYMVKDLLDAVQRPSITRLFSLYRESYMSIEQVASIGGWSGFRYTYGFNHLLFLEQRNISNTAESMGNHTLDGRLRKKTVCLSFYSFKQNCTGWCLATQLQILS